MSTGNLTNAVLRRWISSEGVAVSDLDCFRCNRHAGRKCCDFQPCVPNFLLGAAGLDGFEFSDSSRLTPMGLIPAPGIRARREDLLCEFFEEGRCRIWEFRPGECSAYFCEPKVGQQDLSRRLQHAEVAVAQMALAEYGFSPIEISEQVDLWNGRSDDESSRWSWREVAPIYRFSWEYARGLTINDVEPWVKELEQMQVST